MDDRIDTSVLDDDISRRARELHAASPFTIGSTWDELRPEDRRYWYEKAYREDWKL